MTFWTSIATLEVSNWLERTVGSQIDYNFVPSTCSVERASYPHQVVCNWWTGRAGGQKGAGELQWDAACKVSGGASSSSSLKTSQKCLFRSSRTAASLYFLYLQCVVHIALIEPLIIVAPHPTQRYTSYPIPNPIPFKAPRWMSGLSTGGQSIWDGLILGRCWSWFCHWGVLLLVIHKQCYNK